MVRGETKTAISLNIPDWIYTGAHKEAYTVCDFTEEIYV